MMAGFISKLFGKNDVTADEKKGKSPGKAGRQAPEAILNWLLNRFTKVVEGQKRAQIDYIVAGLGAMCGYECSIAAQPYESILTEIIDDAGLNGRFDCADIAVRTAERANGDDYWHIVFPNGELMTDAPKAFVEMLKNGFECLYLAFGIHPHERDNTCAETFKLMLKRMKTAPSNFSFKEALPLYVRLFTECFYPCALFKWEEKEPGKSAQKEAKAILDWLDDRFSAMAEGQRLVHIDYVAASLGALCGYECFMNAHHYSLDPKELIYTIYTSKNGEKYHDWQQLNESFIDPIMAGVIHDAGLYGMVDYMAIVMETIRRLSNKYWYVKYPSAKLITDTPKSLVEMLKKDMEGLISEAPPQERSNTYVAAFIFLLEDMKAAPPNIPLDLRDYVRLFIECFYLCAIFMWEEDII